MHADAHWLSGLWKILIFEGWEFGLRKLKKLVTAKRFWKINAIQPEIKAIKGKTRKFNFGLNANLGELMK